MKEKVRFRVGTFGERGVKTGHSNVLWVSASGINVILNRNDQHALQTTRNNAKVSLTQPIAPRIRKLNIPAAELLNAANPSVALEHLGNSKNFFQPIIDQLTVDSDTQLIVNLYHLSIFL